MRLLQTSGSVSQYAGSLRGCGHLSLKRRPSRLSLLPECCRGAPHWCTWVPLWAAGGHRALPLTGAVSDCRAHRTASLVQMRALHTAVGSARMLGLSPASCRPRPASSGSYRRSTPVRAMLEQWVTQEDGRVRSNATAAAAAAPEQAVKPGDDDRTRFQLVSVSSH